MSSCHPAVQNQSMLPSTHPIILQLRLEPVDPSCRAGQSQVMGQLLQLNRIGVNDESFHHSNKEIHTKKY